MNINMILMIFIFMKNNLYSQRYFLKEKIHSLSLHEKTLLNLCFWNRSLGKVFTPLKFGYYGAVVVTKSIKTQARLAQL